MRPSSILITVATVILGVVLVAGGALAFTHQIPLHFVLGSLFAAFALLKYAVACDAMVRIRLITAASASGTECSIPDPRATHGTAAMAWIWIGYKILAGSVSAVAAIFVLCTRSGAAHVDALLALPHGAGH